MLARLCIILAAVALTGCRVQNPAAQAQAIAGPVLVVTTSYVGASATVVADTVATPIEQQINGTQGMVRMESESRNDGSFVARLQFQPKTDPNAAVILVQNRITLASPVLPTEVQRAGISVKIDGPADDRHKVIIALIDRNDQGWEALRKWADESVKRIGADGAIVKTEAFPVDEMQIITEFNLAKCADHELRVVDVSQALQAAGPNAKMDTLKKLTVRSKRDVMVPLADVAVLREVSGPSAIYRINLHPAIRITGNPREGKSVSEAALRCVELAQFEKAPADFTVENLSAK